MGLLRKAAQTRRPTPAPAGETAQRAPEPHAKLAPPLTIELAEREAPADVAAEGPQLTPAVPARAGRRLDDVLEEVLTAITSLHGGVELPSRLFTALTTLLGLRKGALLLYDPVRLVYAPWAFLGFDQTTLHRMRIPPGANDAWNALANGRPLSLAGAAAIAPFQQYFSAREAAGVSRLLLVPFIAEEKLIAVLLVSDIDSPFAAEADLMACLARVAEAGTARVHDARAAQMAAADSTAARPEPLSPKDEPTRFITSIGASHATVLLLSLSVEEYSKSVLKAHEHLDPFRLHEDLSYFLRSFLFDIGKVLSVRPGRFIIALPDFEASGLHLFFHQLFLFLQSLFGSNGMQTDAAKPRVVRSASWPTDGADLGSLVESLSS